MLEKERQKTILRIMKQNQFVTVKEMVSLLSISEATIRRDFTTMTRQGFIRRLRGGAEYIESPQDVCSVPPRLPEYSFDVRKGILAEKKRMIAKKAVSLISENETIIIDGGSTTYYMVEYLKALKVRIITNSFAIAEELIKNSENSVIILGGIIYPDSRIILNPFENSILNKYYASKVFMGVNGIDENGTTNSDPLLIQTEKEMIASGKELILLADSSKFSNRGNLFLCGFEKIHTIITDSAIPESLAEMLRSKNIRLIVV